LLELDARRGTNQRCGATEMAVELHLAIAAPSFFSSWAPERPRHAAAAVAPLAARSAPTSSAPFMALRWTTRVIGGAFRA